MNKIETTKILAVLKAFYPNFYKDVDTEFENVVVLWNDMFKDCDYKLVAIAIKELVNTFQYPPTIADIKNKMYELTNVNDISSTDLWDKLLKAIRNGNYGAEKEFEELPEIVKEYVKNPAQLREMASMSSDVIHSVVKGQFLKQIESLKERNKNRNMMLLETRKVLLSDVNDYQIETEELINGLSKK